MFLQERAEVQFVWRCLGSILYASAYNTKLTKTKLSSIYRGKVLGLDEISRVACNSGETQTLKILIPAFLS